MGPARRPLSTHARRAATTIAALGLALPISAAHAPAQDGAAADQQTEEPTRDEPVRECKITLVSGSILKGVLMRSGDERVVLRINGIDTPIERRQIASLEFLPSVEERYRSLRAGIMNQDIVGRLTLVEWLRNRRAYDLALGEIAAILETDPGNARAIELRGWIEAQRELTSKRRGGSDTSATPSPDRAPKPSVMARLSDDEINLIRVYEVDLNDPPPLMVPDDAMRELMEREPSAFPIDREDRDAMLELPEVEKLRILFERKARDLYPRVKVLDDPASLDRFRNRIAGATGWLTNACATTRCHGGAEAGGFRLVAREPNSDATVYTNFLILNEATLDDGTPMIDTADPARSALIQLAMVRAQSTIAHPVVDRRALGRTWRPVFRTPRDRGYTRVVDWIRSLYSPRPDYGIEYDPERPEAPAPDGP